MWSAPVTVTPPAAEPVTLAEAKDYCAVEPDETLHDVKLAGFITAAREQYEAIASVRVMPQIVDVFAGGWADLGRLPVAPVRAVVEIAWRDANGSPTTLAPASYRLTGAGLSWGIVPAPGHSWPGGIDCAGDAIRVRLEVGFDEPPAPIKAYILALVADQMAQRESFAPVQVARMASGISPEALIANYRLWL